jgi:Mrp family chromosome partitioning ATPase
VRPSAELSTTPAPDTAAHRQKRAAPAPSAAAQPAISRIVIQPAGQQVDPDLGGKCAAWQRDNPGRSVWIEVNRKAVSACMGPNGKPTVVQFCAFALLADGRRVKTRNSTDVPYCQALFETWVRERVT